MVALMHFCVVKKKKKLNGGMNQCEFVNQNYMTASVNIKADEI